MSDHHDIRVRKKELRANFRAVRGAITPRQKKRWDAAIFRHILSLPVYSECKTLLCYVSLPDEIDTVPLMQDAWQNGKKVAIPYCVPGTRIIEFYLIDSLENLITGAYDIFEPDPLSSELLSDYTGALCILPGLAYDLGGYRLGYGGGYYDRFLASGFNGNPTAGICYGVCTTGRLERGSFDRPCDYLVTETGAKRIAHRESNNVSIAKNQPE